MKNIDIKSLLLGVLLLGVLGCGSEKDEEAKKTKNVACQWCKEPVKLGAIACPHCLRDDPIWQEPVTGGADPTPDGAAPYVEKAEEMAPPGSGFGGRVGKGETPPPESETPSPAFGGTSLPPGGTPPGGTPPGGTPPGGTPPGGTPPGGGGGGSEK